MLTPNFPSFRARMRFIFGIIDMKLKIPSHKRFPAKTFKLYHTKNDAGCLQHKRRISCNLVIKTPSGMAIVT